MGATLEQFELTQEDYGGLEGKCHEALVLNRPDVIEGVHASMLDAGAEVVEINTWAAEIARKAAGPDRFVAGSIGPTGFLPASDDPTLGDIGFDRLVDTFAEQARGLVAGGAGLIIIETAPDIPEGEAAGFRTPEGFKEAGRT